MNDRAGQAARDRLLRDLLRELRGMRSDGGAERIVERRLASIESRIETALEDMLTRLLGQIIGGGTSGGAVSGIGGLLSSLLDLPRLADGGVIDGGRVLALGGESGPEAVMPLTRLADGRLGVSAEAGQAPVILNITVAGGSEAEQDGEAMSPEARSTLATALGQALDEALDQAVAERIRTQLRDGGLLDTSRALTD